MKQIRLLLLWWVVAYGAAQAQVSFGQPELWNDDWRFSLQDDSLASLPDYNDSHWRKLNLPHDWSIEGIPSPSLASCTGYLPGGVAWYRKRFQLSDTLDRHYVYFEGVYNRSEVYLNGHLLGKRPNGYVSFLYDMTPYLKDGENVLSVRVDHSRYADSRWYTGSGIYRNVWLIASREVHLAQWGSSYRLQQLKNDKAVVAMESRVQNHSQSAVRLQLKTTVIKADGSVVATRRTPVTVPACGEQSVHYTLTVPHVERWELDRPYLYTLRLELFDGTQAIDATDIRMGLRELHFDADQGFALNGRYLKVKGVCLHHDAGVLGAAVPEEVWRRRLLQLKVMGANAIRLSHNPQAPVLYDLCDELGLLVMDEASDEWEFPKRKWIEGWNRGTPGYQGSFDFFEEWMERDVRDMVLRDRNHPSVFLWSIGNEVDYPNDPYSHPILNGSRINQPMYGGYRPDAPRAERIGLIAQGLAKCVREIDSSRPVTGALAGVVMSNETAYPEAVDVVGYNYTENRYQTDHERYPDRIIYGSETGVGFDAWKAVRDNDHIFGQFVWTGIDYLGESGAWPSRGLHTGLLDFAGYPKPRGKFRESLWSEQPMCYIGTYPTGRGNRRGYLSIDALDTWNYAEGQSIRVVCYTNAAQARLLLNGSEVGPLQAYDDQTGIISWVIPYAPGELKAEALDQQGRVVADYTIQTSLRPYALRATADVTQLDGKGAVAHVLLEVVDENGVLVKLADNDIRCLVEGAGELLGLESANNSDMSPATDSHRRVHNGRLLAYVRATQPVSDPRSLASPNEIRVHFSSPLLQPVTLTLTVKN